MSNSCAVVHVFCNVNQDGDQLQTTYRLIFDVVEENEIPGKSFLKVVKFQNLVEQRCKVLPLQNIPLQNLHIFLYYCITYGNCYHFGSQGYIFLIFQDFATKLKYSFNLKYSYKCGLHYQSFCAAPVFRGTPERLGFFL